MKEINFFLHSQIDKIKWDFCVHNAVNSKIYAFSWYLDIVADDWNALVYGDYELVFPITIKQKFIFKKVCQPLFCQQLGSFSPSESLLYDEIIFNQILSFLNKKYTHFSLSMNHYISKYFSMKEKYSSLKIMHKINLELMLNDNYEQVFSNYNNNTKRNLKKIQDLDLSFERIYVVSDFLSLYVESLASKIKLKQKDYKVIQSLLEIILEKNKGSLYGLFNSQRELLSAAFFTHHGNRSILLFNVSKRHLSANSMTLLIDQYIQKKCQMNLIIDFEGSNIISLQKFYKGFGALEKNYSLIVK